jgi:hypothetical protein
MVRQADPITVLRHFQELTSATRKLASIDIPRSVLPDLVTLGDRMHQEALACGRVRPGRSTRRSCRCRGAALSGRRHRSRNGSRLAGRSQT